MQTFKLLLGLRLGAVWLLYLRSLPLSGFVFAPLCVGLVSVSWWSLPFVSLMSLGHYLVSLSLSLSPAVLFCVIFVPIDLPRWKVIKLGPWSRGGECFSERTTSPFNGPPVTNTFQPHSSRTMNRSVGHWKRKNRRPLTDRNTNRRTDRNRQTSVQGTFFSFYFWILQPITVTRSNEPRAMTGSWSDPLWRWTPGQHPSFSLIALGWVFFLLVSFSISLLLTHRHILFQIYNVFIIKFPFFPSSVTSKLLEGPSLPFQSSSLLQRALASFSLAPQHRDPRPSMRGCWCSKRSVALKCSSQSMSHCRSLSAWYCLGQSRSTLSLFLFKLFFSYFSFFFTFSPVSPLVLCSPLFPLHLHVPPILILPISFEWVSLSLSLSGVFSLLSGGIKLCEVLSEENRLQPWCTPSWWLTLAARPTTREINICRRFRPTRTLSQSGSAGLSCDHRALLKPPHQTVKYYLYYLSFYFL